jgi:hypothetical protein
MTETTNLIRYEGDGIRITPEKKTSLYDFIRVVGGQKNPRQALKNLLEQYPEVVQFLDNFKFPGSGQRKTPVADKEGVLKILGLLPGEVGDRYRSEAARLVLAYYEAPEDLAVAAFDRIKDPVKMVRTAARIEGIAARRLETNAFAETGLITEGWQYADLTNATYQGLFGADAKGLKAQLGLKPKDSLRDSLDDISLTAIKLSEMVAASKATTAKNFGELRSLTLTQAKRVKEAIA